jgi:hypothetical protein
MEVKVSPFEHLPHNTHTLEESVHALFLKEEPQIADGKKLSGPKSGLRVVT